jgi:hypothetical protein
MRRFQHIMSHRGILARRHRIGQAGKLPQPRIDKRKMLAPAWARPLRQALQLLFA